MPLWHHPVHDLSREMSGDGDVIGVHGVVKCLLTSRNGSRSASAAPYASSQLGLDVFSKIVNSTKLVDAMRQQ